MKQSQHYRPYEQAARDGPRQHEAIRVRVRVRVKKFKSIDLKGRVRVGFGLGSGLRLGLRSGLRLALQSAIGVGVLERKISPHTCFFDPVVDRRKSGGPPAWHWVRVSARGFSEG